MSSSSSSSIPSSSSSSLPTINEIQANNVQQYLQQMEERHQRQVQNLESKLQDLTIRLNTSSSHQVNAGFSLDDTSVIMSPNPHPSMPHQGLNHANMQHPGPGSMHGTTSSLTGLPRGIKLQLPKAFDGNRVNGTIILSYFGQMDHYLQAAGVSSGSRESLYIVQTNLTGPALLWYQAYVKRNLHEINCWDDLKVAMKIRYYPVSQEQQSMNALLNVKYRGNIEDYNNTFQNHSQMLPVFNDASTDPITMSMYIKGISGTPGTTYLVTTLNNAIQEKKAKSIMELMIIASAAEENLRMSRSGNVSDFNNNNNRNRNNNMAIKVPYVNRGTYQSNYSGAYKPNNTGTPYPRSFQTPQINRFPSKLNQVQFVDEIEEQYQCELNNLSQEDGYGSEVDQLQVHEDSKAEEQAKSGVHQEQEIVLNALQQFNKFGSNNNVSPEEFAKRRQERTCFKCGRQGHFANNCPSNQSGAPKNGP
jgi:hypothetical protein